MCWFLWAFTVLLLALDKRFDLQMDIVDILIRYLCHRGAPVVRSIEYIGSVFSLNMFDNTAMRCAVGSTFSPECVYVLLVYRCLAHSKSYLLPV